MRSVMLCMTCYADRFRGRRENKSLLRLILCIFEQIAGLAAQRPTYRCQCGKANGADVSVFQLAQVHIRYPDLLGQLIQPYLAVCHHAVEPYDYSSHTAPQTVSSCSFWSSAPYLKIIVSTKIVSTKTTDKIRPGLPSFTRT